MYIYVDQRTLHTRGPVPEGPLLGRSSLNALESRVPFRGFGVKYVERGIERYTVNGGEFPVRAGEYLLVNTRCSGSIVIDSKQDVEGLCVELPLRMMDEVVAVHMDPGALDGGCRPGYFSGDLDLQIQAGALTRVGALMRSLLGDPLNRAITSRPLPIELYFRIAEGLVEDHRKHVRDLQKVVAVRMSTRMEILRRVERARAEMHDRSTEPLNMVHFARAAAMSEYHFSRAFRSIHGGSPYQYLLELRMQKAKTLLRDTDLLISEVALACGYADVHGFSKSFNRVIGATPSKFRGSRRN